MARRDWSPNLDTALLVPDQIRVCDLCDVIVLLFVFPDGSRLVWDPDYFQRRWVYRQVGGPVLTAYGFGWGNGVEHVCCAPGNRPVDVIRWAKAQAAKEFADRNLRWLKKHHPGLYRRFGLGLDERRGGPR